MAEKTDLNQSHIGIAIAVSQNLVSSMSSEIARQHRAQEKGGAKSLGRVLGQTYGETLSEVMQSIQDVQSKFDPSRKVVDREDIAGFEIEDLEAEQQGAIMAGCGSQVGAYARATVPQPSKGELQKPGAGEDID